MDSTPPAAPGSPGRPGPADGRDQAPRRPADPTHGVTLAAMLELLVARLGWAEMAAAVDIRCFRFDPSIKSSLQFLRRTPWARAKVEALYVAVVRTDP